ncbi:Ig-like domain-containing protein [Micromonospora polyrhachis]|uniref:Lipoprotein-anchoring transpeptidase ErfK/SrfK n=1 Tax=Micromonospora polyrhachis TaxID=1282883 RepID=A0A7W7SWT4_9ACTN|nr:lipoprotein-anchoring transpeptidase ErfK/SrfK [Micromonospora polyrhachis]
MKSGRLGALMMLVATAPLVLAGCTSEPRKKKEAARPAPPTVAITPAANANNIPVSAEIGAKVTDGKITAVSLVDAKGTKVAGAMRPDGSTWVPSAPLKHSQVYNAEVTATNPGGTITQKSRFTTMAKPAQRVTTHLYLDNDRTYGVAMPVTVAFEPAVPKEARADVQRRLFVNTEPTQPGAWSWVEDGSQIYYRAPDFWQPGTRISVRSALDGLPMGKEGHGDADRTATAKIGNNVKLEIDSSTKQMSVFQDDKLTRKIPVSLGKPSTPTSSGNMVIMEKHEATTFDTRGEPNGGYVVDVEDAQRLTWGGEFIHAAPWSVGDQGNTNVSHGCTNVSNENADWLMRTTQVGDLVTVKGTEVQLQPGNGWTAWNVGWDEYVKGSALPVPADLKPESKPAPAPSGSAATNGPAVPSGPAAPTPSNRGG